MTTMTLLWGLAHEGVHLGADSVRVKLLPRHEPVEMSRRAARHLFRLLQAYNWAVESQEVYGVRWRVFWPSLSTIERKLVVLLLMTHDVDAVGRPLIIADVPVDFEPDIGKPHWGRLHPAIAAEYRGLVSMHYRRLVERDDILVWWKREKGYAHWVELVEAAGVLDKALDPTLGFQPDLVERALFDGLLEAGESQQRATAAARALGEDLDQLMVQREGKFWNDIADS